MRLFFSRKKKETEAVAEEVMSVQQELPKMEKRIEEKKQGHKPVGQENGAVKKESRISKKGTLQSVKKAIRPSKQDSKQVKKESQKVQIIPLGGLGEIGKNMTAFRCGNDIIVVDAGLMFPEEDMLGVDLVIPDITYLLENRDKVRGIFLTHGHEDHIGALPYVVKQLPVPVYGTALTLGICKGRMDENGVSTKCFQVVKPGDVVQKGNFKVEFIRVNHSIPDAVAVSISTPVGRIIHTGDFKIDHTPVDGQVMQFNKFAEFGDEGVLCLLADSTNAEREGFTPSEKLVGQRFDEEFATAKDRIIVATFSSNVHRIQQVIDSAVRVKRHVAVVGRSMENVVRISKELGYLQAPKGVLIDIDEIRKFKPCNVVIVTTGSQGEPMSALTRMSVGDHRKVNIVPGDTIIISATPIPGNEKLVSQTVDNLYKLGANVVYERSSGVHVSGHASQEEMKLMQNLVRPKFFVPVHGEYRHLMKHARLAQSLGMPKENVVIGENGSVIEVTEDKIKLTGKVQAGSVRVDGLGTGDIGDIVLRDRRLLSQDGVMIAVVTLDKENCRIVGMPDIVSRGFVYVRDNEELMDEARKKVTEALENCMHDGRMSWPLVKSTVRDVLGRFLFEKTRRRPMILPIIMEV